MWTEKQKFWFETGRTALFATVASLVALIFIKPLESKSAHNSYLSQSNVEIKKEVIDSFLKSAISTPPQHMMSLLNQTYPRKSFGKGKLMMTIALI